MKKFQNFQFLQTDKEESKTKEINDKKRYVDQREKPLLLIGIKMRYNKNTLHYSCHVLYPSFIQLISLTKWTKTAMVIQWCSTKNKIYIDIDIDPK